MFHKVAPTSAWIASCLTGQPGLAAARHALVEASTACGMKCSSVDF